METPTLQIGSSSSGQSLPALSAVDFLTGRGFITGKSGSGKSNTAGVLIEEMLSEGLPMLVVDTDGEYFGLKEEHEVLHVGADETCDLQVGPEHAGRIAELLLGQNVPVVLFLTTVWWRRSWLMLPAMGFDLERSGNGPQTPSRSKTDCL